MSKKIYVINIPVDKRAFVRDLLAKYSKRGPRQPDVYLRCQNHFLYENQINMGANNILHGGPGCIGHYIIDWNKL